MKAFYAGSFDPFTIGHLSIAKRALDIFGELIIGVGYNESKSVETGIESRVENIRKAVSQYPGIKVIAYTGLTARAAKENGANVLVRGVRNSNEFEKEKELADINLNVLGMPTIMIPAEPTLSYISSSMVRELKHNGFDVSEFLPQP